MQKTGGPQTKSSDAEGLSREDGAAAVPAGPGLPTSALLAFGGWVMLYYQAALCDEGCSAASLFSTRQMLAAHTHLH